MKDVCLCIFKETETVHSIGVNNGEGKYYSEEGGGCFDLNNNADIFEYREMDWQQFRELINKVI